MVVTIHIARAAGGPMQALEAVRAVAGRGLEGDRYFARAGTFSAQAGGDHEVTLIDADAVAAAARAYGVALDPGDARRNLITRGIALEGLVGRDFEVGEVLLRGVRPCEPCKHFARLLGERVVPRLRGHGGLRALIVTGGLIRVGDQVRPVPAKHGA